MNHLMFRMEKKEVKSTLTCLSSLCASATTFVISTHIASCTWLIAYVFHDNGILNSRTIFQHKHCKLLISITYVLSRERPRNTNKSILQELPFSITLHIENILSFWVWVRTYTNLLHCINIDKYYVNMNLFTIIVLNWILQF